MLSVVMLNGVVPSTVNDNLKRAIPFFCSKIVSDRTNKIFKNATAYPDKKA